MRLVIDTNRLIAALIKDRLCRSIILSNNYTFISPDFIVTEIEKYKKYILKKSALRKNSFNTLMGFLLERIEIVPNKEYKKEILKASKIISDKKDVPFLALAISAKADGIWSDDKHFQEQHEVKIYSTKDLAEES